MRRWLAIMTVICVAVTAVAADPARDAEIAALRQTLEATPGDVDSRFALAVRLSWSGQRDDARTEAERVVTEAPTYWDAHVLLARIDGWEARYPSARARLKKVLAAQPASIDALTLAVDIELWAGDADGARRQADALIRVDDSAEARFRRARAAALSMSATDTRRWARRVLEVDPAHAGARGLLSGSHLVRFIATSEVEIFPGAESSVALGQTFVATVFPRSRWSATAGYEYRRRFGTDNHRASLSAAHRLTPQLDVDALLRAGSTEVVPELSASVGAHFRWRRYYTFGLRYHGDKMPWPGQLHRFIASAEVGLPAQATLRVAYEGGLLRYCSNTDPVQGVSLRGGITHDWLTAGAVYAFGMELDRAPLAPFLEDRFGDDVCEAGAMGNVELTLEDTRAQIIGGEIGYQRPNKIAAGAGYTANIRFGGDLVHAGHITLRLWF